MTVSKLSAVFSLKFIAILLICTGIANSQTAKILHHVQDQGDKISGIFLVTSADSPDETFQYKVKEVSISVLTSKTKKISFSADIIEESVSKPSKELNISIKSYADPDFTKKQERIEDDQIGDENAENNEGNEYVGTVEQDAEEVDENLIPTKMYLQLIENGNESNYDFFDKNDLEGIIANLNSRYGTNYIVTGSGRNVGIQKLPDEKTESIKTVTSRVNVTKQQLESGVSAKIAGFDILKFEAELLNDKILGKEGISSFTILIEPGDLYINGNRIDVKLTAKYRNILDNLSFRFDDE